MPHHATCALLSLLSMASTSVDALKMPILEPGCRKGSSYVNAPTYGVSSSQWGHLPRGGWRGAVLGPGGDKIYGIPTNATSVRDTQPSRARDGLPPTHPLTFLPWSLRHACRCSRSTP
mgnify:CR=1 FL=1